MDANLPRSPLLTLFVAFQKFIKLEDARVAPKQTKPKTNPKPSRNVTTKTTTRRVF
jgi:hypothetical protein